MTARGWRGQGGTEKHSGGSRGSYRCGRDREHVYICIYIYMNGRDGYGPDADGRVRMLGRENLSLSPPESEREREGDGVRQTGFITPPRKEMQRVRVVERGWEVKGGRGL